MKFKLEAAALALDVPSLGASLRIHLPASVHLHPGAYGATQAALT